MVAVSKFLSLATLLVGAASASDVVQLTGKTFADFINKHDVVMAEFYAPWCGHCQALAPEYELAATELKEKNLYIAKIDCDEEQALCAEQQIQGYPTLKVFHGLDNSFPYQGPRKADSIVSHLIKHSLPLVSTLTKDNIEDFTDASKYSVVAFFDDAKSNTTFSELAESLRDKYVFGASSDADLAATYGIKKLPGVVAFKNFEDEKEVAVFTDKFVIDEVTQFIQVESFPTIGEIGPGTFAEYTSSGLPLLYIFADNEEDKEEISSYIRPHAEKLKGKVHVGTLDAKAFGQHATNVNLRQEFPALVIEDFVSKKKFTHSQDEPITKKSVKKYLDAFAAGTLEATIKSAPIPATQEGPVYTAVAKNYESLVLDDDKDVLIEFYAPWCGHCKNLAPIYDELGALFFENSELDAKVAIAKMDHTENEVPLDIPGYPTIKLFPAGKKDSPIDFKGARTLEGLAEFIKEYGTHGIDVLAGGAASVEEVEEEVVVEKKAAKKAPKKAAKKASKKAAKDEL